MTPAAAVVSSSALSAADGSRHTLLTQIVRLGCKALSVTVVARLVPPADHGLYAMAGTVVVLLFVFLDIGFGTALVQAPAIPEDQQPALLRAHLILGAALAAVMLAASPAVAWFYGRADLVPLLIVASPAPLLNAASGLPRALLQRGLQFRTLNRIETASAVIGTLAMIASAALGARAYTFVVFLLVSETVSAALAWRLGPWRPRLAGAPAADLRKIFRTTGQLVGYHLVNYFVQQLDTLVVGRYFGARPLGLYSRSNQLLALPQLHVAAPLTRVNLAVLARQPPDSAEFARQCRAAPT